MRFFSRRDKILEDKTNEGELRRKAEKGDPNAQFNLGRCFEKGKGVEQDKAEAARWYRKSAEQGHPSAQNNLGFMYLYGDGVTKDSEEAFRWFSAAAEQGNAAAQNNLGHCLEKGDGVKADRAEAVRWYRKSAEQGMAVAQYNLGHCYDKGLRVEQDKAEAARWYRKSADQGWAQAMNCLACLCYYGFGVEESDDEAFRLWKAAAELGEEGALENLAFCYEPGIGTKKIQKKQKNGICEPRKQGRSGQSPIRTIRRHNRKWKKQWPAYAGFFEIINVCLATPFFSKVQLPGHWSGKRQKHEPFQIFNCKFEEAKNNDDECVIVEMNVSPRFFVIRSKPFRCLAGLKTGRSEFC